jgi:hypothetical protein
MAVKGFITLATGHFTGTRERDEEKKIFVILIPGATISG